jgi:hypothetical protein
LKASRKPIKLLMLAGRDAPPDFSSSNRLSSSTRLICH